MKQLIDLIIEKMNHAPLRAISEATGIQITRCHRIRSKTHTMDVEELSTLAEYYGMTPTGVTQKALIEAEIEAHKEIARQQAYTEIWAQAETKVAQKYGITAEVMEWRICDPKFQAKAI